MKNINFYVTQKIKLRKTLMVIFSVCAFLLICGILNAVMEKDNSFEKASSELNLNGNELQDISAEQKTPREVVMEKRDRNIRIFSALIITLAMIGAVLSDIIFIKCPVCGHHIAFCINPTACRRCGTSFLPGKTDGKK